MFESTIWPFVDVAASSLCLVMSETEALNDRSICLRSRDACADVRFAGSDEVRAWFQDRRMN